MAVDQPWACFRCHDDMRDLVEIAHPHQVLGPNGMVCTTCHDAHGQVLESTRTDVCLDCHQGAPTAAWHTSVHSLESVACADCHDPHPKTNVPRLVHISHTSVRRSQRLPMSVSDPDACYQCHQDILALTRLPSHHPIMEGKMGCTSCHDGHGQFSGNLTAESVNDVCYKCHAEKEGPFVYEHEPVTENCVHCHNPHGTVANNLLHQPTTFLCLRCHSGHSAHDQFLGGRPFNLDCNSCHDSHGFGNNNLDDMGVPGPADRQALLSDCTHCHRQVHGSDLPSSLTLDPTQFR